MKGKPRMASAVVGASKINTDAAPPVPEVAVKVICPVSMLIVFAKTTV